VYIGSIPVRASIEVTVFIDFNCSTPRENPVAHL
jgi:hypothetical protein